MGALCLPLKHFIGKNSKCFACLSKIWRDQKSFIVFVFFRKSFKTYELAGAPGFPIELVITPTASAVHDNVPNMKKKLTSGHSPEIFTDKRFHLEHQRCVPYQPGVKPQEQWHFQHQRAESPSHQSSTTFMERAFSPRCVISPPPGASPHKR